MTRIDTIHSHTSMGKTLLNQAFKFIYLTFSNNDTDLMELWLNKYSNGRISTTLKLINVTEHNKYTLTDRQAGFRVMFLDWNRPRIRALDSTKLTKTWTSRYG